MSYRKRWKSDWAELKYCSEKKRKKKPNQLDKAIEQRILTTLANTRATTDEAIYKELEPKWDRLRERTRRAARRLEAEGKLLIYQQGKKVDSSNAKGTLELRLKS